MVTLYNVISKDGYMGRKNSEEDFIPDELWPITLSLIKKYDGLMLGRKTYESMKNYDRKLLDPFEKLNTRKIIVTSNKNYPIKPGYEIANNLESFIENNENILVSSGPILNNYLLEERLVNKIILHQLPNLIEEGILPFKKEALGRFVLTAESQVGPAKQLIYEIISN